MDLLRLYCIYNKVWANQARKKRRNPMSPVVLHIHFLANPRRFSLSYCQRNVYFDSPSSVPGEPRGITFIYYTKPCYNGLVAKTRKIEQNIAIE